MSRRHATTFVITPGTRRSRSACSAVTDCAATGTADAKERATTTNRRRMDGRETVGRAACRDSATTGISVANGAARQPLRGHHVEEDPGRHVGWLLAHEGGDELPFTHSGLDWHVLDSHRATGGTSDDGDSQAFLDHLQEKNDVVQLAHDVSANSSEP